jgi:hypothetical protein
MDIPTDVLELYKYGFPSHIFLITNRKWESLQFRLNQVQCIRKIIQTKNGNYSSSDLI